MEQIEQSSETTGFEMLACLHDIKCEPIDNYKEKADNEEKIQFNPAVEYFMEPRTCMLADVKEEALADVKEEALADVQEEALADVKEEALPVELLGQYDIPNLHIEAVDDPSFSPWQTQEVNLVPIARTSRSIIRLFTGEPLSVNKYERNRSDIKEEKLEAIEEKVQTEMKISLIDAPLGSSQQTRQEKVVLPSFSRAFRAQMMPMSVDTHELNGSTEIQETTLQVTEKQVKTKKVMSINALSVSPRKTCHEKVVLPSFSRAFYAQTMPMSVDTHELNGSTEIQKTKPEVTEKQVKTEKIVSINALSGSPRHTLQEKAFSRTFPLRFLKERAPLSGDTNEGNRSVEIQEKKPELHKPQRKTHQGNTALYSFPLRFLKETVPLPVDTHEINRSVDIEEKKRKLHKPQRKTHQGNTALYSFPRRFLKETVPLPVDTHEINRSVDIEEKKREVREKQVKTEKKFVSIDALSVSSRKTRQKNTVLYSFPHRFLKERAPLSGDTNEGNGSVEFQEKKLDTRAGESKTERKIDIPLVSTCQGKPVARTRVRRICNVNTVLSVDKHEGNESGNIQKEKLDKVKRERKVSSKRVKKAPGKVQVIIPATRKQPPRGCKNVMNYAKLCYDY